MCFARKKTIDHVCNCATLDNRNGSACTRELARTYLDGRQPRETVHVINESSGVSGRGIFLFYSWDHLTEAHHGPLLCFILLGCPGRPPGVLGYSDDNLHAGPIAPRPTANGPAHSISSSPAESNQRPPIIRRYKKSISISVQIRIEMGRLWPGFGGGGGLMLPKSILGSHFYKKEFWPHAYNQFWEIIVINLVHQLKSATKSIYVLYDHIYLCMRDRQ